MRHFRFSIRAKLGVLNIGLAVLPLVVLGAVAVIAAQVYLRREARQDLGRELTAVDREVRALYAALKADALTARAFVERADARELPVTLRTFGDARPAYGSISVLDPVGRLVAHVERPRWAARESPYYATLTQEMAVEAVAILPVELLAADSAQLVRPTLGVVTPVALAGREGTFALVLELDADTLLNIFHSASSAMRGALAVLSRDGFFLFHSGQVGRSEGLLNPSLEPALWAHLGPDQMSDILSGLPGELVAESRLVTFQPVGPTTLHPEDRLISYREVSLGELTAPARRLGWILGGGLAGVLVVAFVLSTLLARHFTRPILRLRDATRSLAEGQWEAPTVLGSNDELDDLARDFTLMAQQIREQRTGLETLVSELKETEGRLREEEQALRQSERRYASLVDSVDGIVWEADGEALRFSFVSRQAERILGYPTGQWLAEPTFWLDHVHADDRDRVVDIWRSAMREQRSREFECRMIAADGRTVWLRNSVAVGLGDGGSAKLRGLMVDITQRKAAQEAVQSSEASYRSLVENAPYGIFRCTLEGEFVAVNRALVEMLGYGDERELLAADIGTGVYADPKEWAGLVQTVREHGRAGEHEAHWKRRDGAEIFVRLNGHAVAHTADGTRFLEMTAEDVTERRALEGQLRQAQKMEAVGQLAGGMAHDFNNLLTTILASSELLESTLPPDSPLLEDLKVIRRAGTRGAGLIRKLLAFSRKGRLEFQPVHLGDLVGEFTGMLRRVLPETIEIQLELGESEPTVQADPGAVEQILLNLVTNARDAMPHGGRIRIRTGRATMDEAFCAQHGWGQVGEYGVLTVGDTGTGMDAETVRRVFEPFFTTKPVGSGTGLGLAIVYGLVKNHAGYIDLTSEPGRGTTVTVYLQATTETTAEPAPREVPSRPETGAETILLVEDEETLRKMAKRVLESHGYTVLAAADGADALDVFREHEGEIRLIISDVVMPRMGGPELRAQLESEGKHVKILFTSGYADRDVRRSARLPADTPILAKPWTIEALLRKVREALET